MIQFDPRCEVASPPGRPVRLTTDARPVRNRTTIVGMLAWVVTAFALVGCTSGPEVPADPRTPEGNIRPADPLQLIRETAEHEGLYTLAGGLKPMSTGIWRGSYEIDAPDLADLREVRQALEVLRNDAWYADVQVFAKPHDGERSAHAFVIHRKALARMIERHDSFWGPWGITPCTHPAEIVAIVDRMPRDDRWRGYGYLFGYPDHAVDFFVEAGLAAEDGREVGPGKDRQFVQIPTSAADSGRFTYAVPIDHVPTMTDQALADHARLILDAYEQRRPKMRDVGGAIDELLRLNDRFEGMATRDMPASRKATAK